jgi:hypothetical protein
MTPTIEEKRRALAEWFGWSMKPAHSFDYGWRKPYHIPDQYWSGDKLICDVKDWTPDLEIKQAIGNKPGTIVGELHRKGYWFSLNLNSCMEDDKPTDDGYFFAEFYKGEVGWSGYGDTPEMATFNAAWAVKEGEGK